MINNSNIKQHGSYPEFEQKAIYTFSGNVVEPTEIMTISQSSLTIEEGETATLSVSVQDDPNRAIVWSSSDVTVATVEGGVITAIKAGETTITASGGKVSATCVVTVEAPVPQPIPVEGDIQIFADVECTQYATGVTDKVYARINNPWGIDENWSAGSEQSNKIVCEGPTTESLDTRYLIDLWDGFASEDQINPYNSGQIVKLIYAYDPMDVSQFTKIFTKPE